MSTQQELLPCPFCGGKATLSHIEPHKHAMTVIGGLSMPDYSGGVTVECFSCDAGFIRDTEADAITAWNTRASLPAVEQTVPYFNRQAIERAIESCENPAGMHLNDSKERPILPGGTLRRLLAVIDAISGAQHAEVAGPQSLESEQWYWVRYEGIGKTYEAPALYKENSEAFYSFEFSGIPTRQVTVLGRLRSAAPQPPKEPA